MKKIIKEIESVVRKQGKDKIKKGEKPSPVQKMVLRKGNKK